MGATGAAGVGTAFSAEAAVSSVSGTLCGAAAKCWNMSRHGTPGLGSAAALALSTRTGQISPAVAMAVMARRFVVRDMVFSGLSDGKATDRSSSVLLKLLK
jgi:hypothetical protein